MSRPLADTVTAFVVRHAEGVQPLALPPLAGGDERRLGLLLWDLAVRGLVTVLYADGDQPELVLPGPCHAVAQRFAAICPWCRDRLAALNGATR